MSCLYRFKQKYAQLEGEVTALETQLNAAKGKVGSLEEDLKVECVSHLLLSMTCKLDV